MTSRQHPEYEAPMSSLAYALLMQKTKDNDIPLTTPEAFNLDSLKRRFSESEDYIFRDHERLYWHMFPSNNNDIAAFIHEYSRRFECRIMDIFLRDYAVLSLQRGNDPLAIYKEYCRLNNIKGLNRDYCIRLAHAVCNSNGPHPNTCPYCHKHMLASMKVWFDHFIEHVCVI